MGQEIKKISPRTKLFIRHYNDLKEAGKFNTNADLLDILGYRRDSSITEILAERQNIPVTKFLNFLEHFGIKNTDQNTEKHRTDYASGRMSREVDVIKAENVDIDLRVAIRKLSEATERHSVIAERQQSIDDRNSRTIERLVSLLERQYAENGGRKGIEPGADHPDDVTVYRKEKKQ